MRKIKIKIKKINHKKNQPIFFSSCARGGGRKIKIQPFFLMKKDLKIPPLIKEMSVKSGRDMDLSHYNLNDLYHLFHLSEEDKLKTVKEQLKLAKKLMAQTHPDKSKLPDMYFQFFRNAYKKLSIILNSKQMDTENAIEDENLRPTLDNYFQYRPDLLDPNVLNQWLNTKFEQHIQLEKPKGHADWFASEQGMPTQSFEVNSIDDIHRNFEKLRTQNQHQLVAVEIQAWDASSSLDADYLGDPNELYEQGYGSCQGKYFDVKEAFTPSILPLIPIQNGGNLRQSTTQLSQQRKQEEREWKPMSKEAAENLFLEQKQKEEEKEKERRWYQATQSEALRKQTDAFHGELLHLMPVATNHVPRKAVQEAG